MTFQIPKFQTPDLPSNESQREKPPVPSHSVPEHLNPNRAVSHRRLATEEMLKATFNINLSEQSERSMAQTPQFGEQKLQKYSFDPPEKPDIDPLYRYLSGHDKPDPLHRISTDFENVKIDPRPPQSASDKKIELPKFKNNLRGEDMTHMMAEVDEVGEKIRGMMVEAGLMDKARKQRGNLYEQMYFNRHDSD